MFKTRLDRLVKQMDGSSDLMPGTTMEQVPVLNPKLNDLNFIINKSEFLRKRGLHNDDDLKCYRTVLEVCDEYLAYNPNYGYLEGIFRVDGIRDRMQDEIDVYIVNHMFY